MCSPFIASTARQDTPLVSISRELPEALSMSQDGEDFSGSPSSQPNWHLPESVIQRQMLLNKLGRSSAGGRLNIESIEDLTAASVAPSGEGKRARLQISDTGSFSSDTREEAAGQKLRQLVSAQLDRISDEEDDNEDTMSLEERDEDEIGSSHHSWDDSDADEEEKQEGEGEDIKAELADGYKAAVGSSTEGISSSTGSESHQAKADEPSSLKPSDGPSVTMMDADASLRLLRSLVAGLPSPADKENPQIGPGLGGRFAMKGGLAKVVDRGPTSSHPESPPQSLEPTSRSSEKAAPEVPGSSGRTSLFGTESKRRWAAAAAATSANDSQRPDVSEAALQGGGTTAVVTTSDDGFSAESQQCGPVAAAFSHRFPAYGVGLIDRLMSLEDHGLFKWETVQQPPIQQRSHRQGRASSDSAGSRLPAGERPPGPRGEEGPLASNVGGLTQDTAQLVEAMAAALASSSSNAVSPLGSQAFVNNDRSFNRAPLPTSYLQSHPRPLLPSSARDSSSGENADERQVALDQLRREVFGAQHDLLSAAESPSPQNASQRAVKESLPSGTWLSGGGDDTIDTTSEHSARLIGGAGSRLRSGVGPSDNLDGGANLLGALAMRSSSRWPRIYRPPRARGGHVILDLCVHDAEAEAEARRQQGSDGVGGLMGAEFGKLERHVSQSGALYS